MTDRLFGALMLSALAVVVVGCVAGAIFCSLAAVQQHQPWGVPIVVAVLGSEAAAGVLIARWIYEDIR